MFRGVLYLFEYSVALLRIFLLISLVCFAPRIFFIREAKSFVPCISLDTSPYQSDVKLLTSAIIQQWCPAKVQPKVALITTDKDYRNIYDTPIDTVWYMDAFTTFPDSTYKDQAYSLCMKHDLMLLDIPSIGLSSVSSCHFLFDVLDNAALNKIPVVIYDRPNMLGKKIEGPVCSFMRGNRCFKVPFRHGMTLAELADYYNADVLANKATLHIMSINNYNRADLSWIQNMCDQGCPVAGLDFMVCGILRQIAPLSSSCNLDQHACIMLPPEITLLEQQWYQLQALLREFGITSFLYRYSDKDSQGIHRGLKLDSINVDEVDYFKVVLAIIDFFKDVGVSLIVSERLDQCMGTSLVRHYAKGMISKKKLFVCTNKDLELFYRSAFGHFMYYPLPQLSLM